MISLNRSTVYASTVGTTVEEILHPLKTLECRNQVRHWYRNTTRELRRENVVVIVLNI